MPTPHPDTAARSQARRAERKLLEMAALERGRRRLTWRALKLLRERLATNPETVKDEVLVAIAKLDQGDRDKSLTLRGDPARPLVIGLAPARDLQPPPDVPQIAPPKPPELVNGNAIIPQRFSLTEVAEALRAKRERDHDNP